MPGGIVLTTVSDRPCMRDPCQLGECLIVFAKDPKTVCLGDFSARSHRHAQGLPRCPGAGGAQEGCVLGSSLRLPRQEGRHDEDPVLGWERILSVRQAAAAGPLYMAVALRAWRHRDAHSGAARDAD